MTQRFTTIVVQPSGEIHYILRQGDRSHSGAFGPGCEDYRLLNEWATEMHDIWDEVREREAKQGSAPSTGADLHHAM